MVDAEEGGEGGQEDRGVCEGSVDSFEGECGFGSPLAVAEHCPRRDAEGAKEEKEE